MFKKLICNYIHTLKIKLSILLKKINSTFTIYKSNFYNSCKLKKSNFIWKQLQLLSYRILEVVSTICPKLKEEERGEIIMSEIINNQYQSIWWICKIQRQEIQSGKKTTKLPINAHSFNTTNISMGRPSSL